MTHRIDGAAYRHRMCLDPANELQAGADRFQREEDGLDFFSYADMLRSNWSE